LEVSWKVKPNNLPTNDVPQIALVVVLLLLEELGTRAKPATPRSSSFSNLINELLESETISSTSSIL